MSFLTALAALAVAGGASVPAIHDSVRWTGRTLRHDQNGTVKYACAWLKDTHTSCLAIRTSPA